jgi:hypothetical protein
LPGTGMIRDAGVFRGDIETGTTSRSGENIESRAGSCVGSSVESSLELSEESWAEAMERAVFTVCLSGL